MNQKIIIADDFYDVAFQYRQSFLENQCLITDETVNKITEMLQQKVNVVEAFNECVSENTKNPITANTACDWIAVIYLTMPAECVSKQGMSFYIHKKTELDAFPDDYAKSLFGLQTMEDLEKTFDVCNPEDWKEYMNIFVKYNRIVLFRADRWHSYGKGFGEDLNNSMIYQKVLLKNGS
jgi:hypothetical protein